MKNEDTKIELLINEKQTYMSTRERAVRLW